jgi:hypothetical protein
VNRRFVLVAGVGGCMGLPGCSVLDDPTRLTLEYENRTGNDVTLSVLLQENEGIYVDEDLEITAGDTYGDTREVDESGPLSLEVSIEGDSRGRYDHTVGVEEDVTVEVVVTESSVGFDESG